MAAAKRREAEAEAEAEANPTLSKAVRKVGRVLMTSRQSQRVLKGDARDSSGLEALGALLMLQTLNGWWRGQSAAVEPCRAAGHLDFD